MTIAKVKYMVGKTSDPSRDTDIVLDLPGHGYLKVFGPYALLEQFRKGASVKISRADGGPLRTEAYGFVNLELVAEPALPDPPVPAAATVTPEQTQAYMLARIEQLTGWWATCFEAAQRQLPTMSEEGQRAVATSIFIQMSQGGAFRR